MIIPLDLEHLPDVNRVNEPFMVIGRLLPTYVDGKWSLCGQLGSSDISGL